MAFTVLTTGVRAKRVGRDLRVDWTSALASTTVWQLYVNKVLAWSGTNRFTVLPWPSTTTRIDVGSVGSAAESTTDYSGSLPAGSPGTKAHLTWFGGTWEGSDLTGWNIYSSAVAGGAIDYSTSLAFVPVGNTGTGGFGVGGWGQGGWGDTGGSYVWEGESLTPGVWLYAVVPIDSAGNANGSPSTTSVTAAGPPRPPAASADGTRLSYTFNNTNHQPTLSWLAAP